MQSEKRLEERKKAKGSGISVTSNSSSKANLSGNTAAADVLGDLLGNQSGTSAQVSRKKECSLF